MDIAVFGIGNILLSDDGVGVHTLNRLQEEYDLPEYVQLIDGGTKGLDLLPLLEERDKVPMLMCQIISLSLVTCRMKTLIHFRNYRLGYPIKRCLTLLMFSRSQPIG